MQVQLIIVISCNAAAIQANYYSMHSTAHLDTHRSDERSEEIKQILIFAPRFDAKKCNVGKSKIAHVIQPQLKPVESKITIGMTCRKSPQELLEVK